MRIGICFFMESNLGGAATQANDMVTMARRLGHEACLLRFTTRSKGRGLYNLLGSVTKLPSHDLLYAPGLKFSSERILLSKSTIDKVLDFLNTFNLLIFVGVCPHITREFSEEDFLKLYSPLYTGTTPCKVLFFTDPFWQRLYPFANDIVEYVDRIDAFAEAYKRDIVDSGLCDNVDICNFGSVMAFNISKFVVNVNTSDRLSRFVWPHQWRSWKNPATMIRMAPSLLYHTLAYSDGIEYHKIRRDMWEEYRVAIRRDHVKEEDLNPEGNVEVFGVVSQESLLEVVRTSRWMIDLTGMSGRTGKPIDKFVGNYQCVNIECMMLGCVNFKYENTVAPYSQIPRDCVISMPLVADPIELSKFINKNTGISRYKEVANRAREWSLSKFNPEKVFKEMYIDPFTK